MRPHAERSDVAGAAVTELGAVIDLGEDREPVDDAPAPHGRPGWAVLAVLVALLGGLAASGSPPPAPLRPTGDVELSLADTYAVTAEDLLLIHSPARSRLAAYDLRDGERRWQVPAPAVSYRLRSGAGLVLMRPRGTVDPAGRADPDPGTIALSAGDGRTRWRLGGTVVAIAGAPTVLVVSEIRSLAGAGRRVEGTIHGVDPVTGQPRWTLDLPAPAVLQPLPGTPARALLVHGDGRAELRALDTGAVLGRGQLPPADYGPGNPDITGGMVLLRHTTEAGSQVSAYDAGTLAPRWTRPAALDVETRSCGASACLIGVPGIRAIDPVTGAHRWFQPRWQAIEERGSLLLAFGSGSAEEAVVGAADPVTGRVLVDLHRWRPLPSADPAGPVLVTRVVVDAAGEPGTVVGVVDAAAGRVRTLDRLPPDATDCRSTATRLVCRADGRLLVWDHGG